MSKLPEITLKSRLLQIKCHFTWQFQETDMYLDEMENRVHSQLTYLVTKSKHMVYNLLAYIMHIKGDYTKAIANLEEAEANIKEYNPDGTERKYLVTFGDYAWVYYYLQRYEDSQNYIDKIDKIYKELQLCPGDSKDLPEIYGEQGWSLLTFSGQCYERAKECFEKALEQDPEDPEWNSGYATVVYRLEGFNGRKCPASECKSLELLIRAVALNPDDAVVKALLALKLQDLNRANEGRKYVEDALEQAPNLPYLLRYVAKFYRRAGLVDEALRVLKAAVDLIPSSGFLHHQMGVCYKQKINMKRNTFGKIQRYKRGRQMHTGEIDELTQKAIFHFEKALEYKKTFIYGYIELANMYIQTMEYRKAEDTFEKALSIPDVISEEKQQIHFLFGCFLEHTKKSEIEAIKYYKKGFLITDPSKFRENCGKSLKRLAERKILSDHRDALGFSLLGFVYKNSGNISEAIECYEKAIKYDPDNEEYLSDLCGLVDEVQD